MGLKDWVIARDIVEKNSLLQDINVIRASPNLEHTAG